MSRTLYRMFHLQSSTSSSDEAGVSRQELIKTANLLFAQLDTSYVWTMCAKHFQSACQSSPAAPQVVVVVVDTISNPILRRTWT